MQKIVTLFLYLASLSLIGSDREQRTLKRLTRVEKLLHQLECTISVKKPDIDLLNQEIARAFLDLGPLGKQTEYPHLFARATELNRKLTALLEAQKRPVKITISDA